ncbi:hypothetical protein H072_6502 [Dactylellina haptotyla CBS 200.50]|uniref:CHAT domain-containing protein n=1 Tax=Dactylellina haptotyla (strain CBS 200.50) TaxID=1284197 RepID=S8BWH4_DACHA|nr:hypothetical protein H072_6502 [Dactylellina haptotyla CBS 200.50]
MLPWGNMLAGVGFRIDQDMMDLIDSVEDEDFENFLDLHSSPSNDAEIELFLYICFKVSHRFNDFEYLDRARDHSEGWLAVTPDGHPDQGRRAQIHHFLSFMSTQMPVLSRTRKGKGKENRETGFDESRGRVYELDSDDNDQEERPFGLPPIITNPQHIAWWKENLEFEKKYADTKNLSDLNKAIDITKNAIDSFPTGYPTLELWLAQLGRLLAFRFARTQDISDISKAIDLTRESIDLTDFEDANRCRRLGTLAYQLNLRFKKAHNIDDNSAALDAVNEGISTARSDEELLTWLFYTLGEVKLSRFDISELLEDFATAIEYTKKAVDLTPPANPMRRERALRLKDMFQKSLTIQDPEENIEDVSRMVDITELALETYELWDGRKDAIVHTLAERLIDRFDITSTLKDFIRLLEIAETAKHIDYSQDKVFSGAVIGIRNYLQEVIEDPTKMEGENKEILSTRVSNLISADNDTLYPTPSSKQKGLMYWYIEQQVRIQSINKRSSKAMRLIQRMIELCQENLELDDLDMDDTLFYIMTLGTIYHQRYLQTEDPDNLQPGIDYLETAINLAPPGFHGTPAIVLNLVNSLVSRFQHRKDISDLDTAIGLIEKHSGEMTQAWMKRKLKMSLLSILSTRIQITESMEDLLEAIRVAKDYLDTEARAEQWNLVLGQYAVFNGILSDRTGDIKYIDLAIDKLTDTLKGTYNPDVRATFLNSLGELYRNRYSHFGDAEDLERSLEAHSQAGELVTGSSMDLYATGSHIGLATSLAQKFARTFDIKYLNRAIEVAEQAVKELPAGARVMSSHLSTVGDLHYNRGFVVGGVRSEQGQRDFQKAGSAYRAALKCPTVSAMDKFEAMTGLSYVLEMQSRWKEAAAVHRDILKLVSILSPRSMSNADKQHILSKFSNIGVSTAAKMLQAGEEPFEALRQLELGRGVMASLTSEMRIDISELKTKHPKLAKRFESLQASLDAELRSKAKTGSFSIQTTALNESSKRSRRDAEIEFDLLLDEIRQNKGFENFLEPLTKDQLMAAANPDPIVVINIENLRSDAFIVESHRIRSLSLDVSPMVLGHQSRKLREDDEEEAWSVLEWLWEKITRPILEALGIDGPPNPENGKWPRIWWVPTGELCQVPIHASGKHIHGSDESVLDRVVSSYALSVRSLIYGRNNNASPPVSQQPEEMGEALLVSMAETSERPFLRYAGAEVEALEDLCKSLDLKPVKPQRTRDDILKHLATCKVFHFAGHGDYDSVDPSKSVLLVEDWQTAPLTVADFWKHNLRAHPPFLAYLSACSTGATSQTFSSEGINIMSACQLAGFRHVIGTQWEVNDAYCVKVAQKFYEGFQRNGFSDLTVALSLHHAIKSLRDQWVETNRRKASQIRQTQYDTKIDIEAVLSLKSLQSSLGSDPLAAMKANFIRSSLEHMMQTYGVAQSGSDGNSPTVDYTGFQRKDEDPRMRDNRKEMLEMLREMTSRLGGKEDGTEIDLESELDQALNLDLLARSRNEGNPAIQGNMFNILSSELDSTTGPGSFLFQGLDLQAWPRNEGGGTGTRGDRNLVKSRKKQHKKSGLHWVPFVHYGV